jgi:hypothetical protein
MEMWRQAIGLARCRKLSLNLINVAVAIATGSTGAAQTSVFLPDFSATEIAHVRGREVASKVYRSGLNFRAEPAPGIAMIYVAATNTIYRVMFNGTQCIETKGIEAHSVSSPLQLLSGAKVERRSGEGTEVIDGHTCKVENVTVTAADGTTTWFTLWEATELTGTPVKLELHSDRGSLTTTYRDIAVGTPDAALFTPPKTCKPFEKTYQIAPPGK